MKIYAFECCCGGCYDGTYEGTSVYTDKDKAQKVLDTEFSMFKDSITITEHELDSVGDHVFTVEEHYISDCFECGAESGAIYSCVDDAKKEDTLWQDAMKAIEDGRGEAIDTESISGYYERNELGVQVTYYFDTRIIKLDVVK